MLIVGGAALAASAETAGEAPLGRAEAAAAPDSAALSGIVYQPSRVAAKTAAAEPAAPTEQAVRELAATNSAEGAEASQLLAEANGAALTPGERVNFSDQPPAVIGEMAGLARKSCERAGGAFTTGGPGVFSCE